MGNGILEGRLIGPVTLHATGTTGTGSGTSVGNLAAADVAVGFVVEAVGATPTITFRLQGSVDGTNWSDVKATDAEGTSAVSHTKTSTGVVIVHPQENASPMRWFPFYRVNVTANTNVTYRASLYAKL